MKAQERLNEINDNLITVLQDKIKIYETFTANREKDFIGLSLENKALREELEKLKK